MPTVAEKEEVATTVDTTPESLTLEKVKALIAEELPSLIADALKHSRTAHHQPTTAVKPPQSTVQPDTRATSAKKSNLNWQTAGVIVLMVSVIIGGWWTLEDRFERKLDSAINGVETRLGGEVQEVRQEVQEVRQEIKEVRQEVQEVRQEVQEVRQEVQETRQEINTRIDALYELLLEQR